MKIKIDQASLLAALTDCATVADPKSAFPWGPCVVMSADSGGGLVCRASNSLQSVERVAVGVTVTKAGAVMLNAKDVLQRVSALDSGEVTIDDTHSSVMIKQGGARYVLPKYGADFMPSHDVVEPQGGEVDGAALARLLGRVSPAMGTLESQLSTWGVSVFTEGGKLWAQAINGKVGTIDALTFDGEIRCLIPSPAVKQLQTVLARIEGVARIAVVGTSLYVFADGFTYSALLSGEKPPAVDVRTLPRGALSAQMDRSAAVKAVKAVTIGAARDCRLRLRVGPKGITFRGQGNDAAENSRLVECDAGIVSISIVPDNMLDLLEFSRESTVTIYADPGERKDGKAGGAMMIAEGDAVCAISPIVYDPIDLATDTEEWT